MSQEDLGLAARAQGWGWGCVSVFVCDVSACVLVRACVSGSVFVCVRVCVSGRDAGERAECSLKGIWGYGVLGRSRAGIHSALGLVAVARRGAPLSS